MSTVNLALNKAAYSSTCILPYTASRAVNGGLTPTSRWLCGRLPGWMCVDLGAQYRINGWTLRNMTVAGWRSPDYNIADFKLQGSNSITDQNSMNNNALWTDIDLVTANTLSVVTHSLTNIVSYRYIRLYVTKGFSCNNKLASVTELEIYKAPDSSLLTNLTLSAGTLTPAFSKNTYAYTAEVPNNVTSITLTPTAEQSNAIIKVNGTVTTSGQASVPINLNIGTNAIPVQVTAGDGSSVSTYTVTVTRESSPIYLTNLTLGTGASFKTPFSSQTLNYDVNVGYDASTFTITPVSDDQTATITINGTTVANGSTWTATSPVPGATGAITIVISAPSKSSSTYTLNAIRASNNYLSTLTITPPMFKLNPSFSPSVMNYTATTALSSIAISPIAADSNAAVSVTVNDTPVTGANPKTISFPTTGTYTIKIIVVSAFGDDKRIYTIVVTKN